MRDLFQFCIVVVCLVTTGCSARFAQPPRDTMVFDYVPTTETVPGSADVTFAIVGAEFVAPTSLQQQLFQQQGILLSSAPPPLLFQQLISNMTTDFEEVLTARGYTIEGVYRTFDEMNYPNKEGSDLILTAKVKFDSDTSVQYKEELWNYFGGCLVSVGTLTASAGISAATADARLVIVGGGLALGGVALWRSKGFVPFGRMGFVCEVALEVYEGLTGEIMWSKRIPIPRLEVIPKAVQKENPGEITWQKLMAIDNKFYSDLGRLFQLQYGKILNKIDTYLDPREMVIVKNQALELRKRKVY